MTKKSRPSFARLLSSNWLVTLSATLIGVFVALYLSERVSSNKTGAQMAGATENIFSEIEANRAKLEEGIELHVQMYKAFEFLSIYMTDEEDLVVPLAEMNKFRNAFPGVFTIADSTRMQTGVFNYNGELNLDITAYHLSLTNIAWHTLKSSGLSSSYGFDCLMYLETVDKLAGEVAEQNRLLNLYFIGEKDGGENYENMLRHLKMLIDYERSLKTIYGQSERERWEAVRPDQF